MVFGMDQQGLCLCGCGQEVAAGREWKRGHAARGPGGYRGDAGAPGPRRVPPPDDPVWDEEDAEDAGTIDIDMPPSVSRDGAGASPDVSVPAGDAPPVTDEPPAHSTRAWHKKRQPSKPAAKPVRITAAVRGDITGQLGFLLTAPGSVWAARDPLCGGAFLEQVPAIADALADWVVESPSLLAIFTGPAGSFAAKAVKTTIALAPVFTTVTAHHVYHSIEYDPDLAAEEMAQYAA